MSDAPSDATCPICTLSDLIASDALVECVTCGHEWPKEATSSEAESALTVRDSNGNELASGDAVTLIKDLKVKGSSTTLKAGTKLKKIRLVDPDRNAGHDIDAKADGMGILVRARFVKKA